MIDHLVQHFDNTKPNYAIVSHHLELININYDNGVYQGWSHCNAIDYNSTLAQVMLTSRNNNEVFILDHSTTTAEAATHAGGNSDKGGDLLWRWGNAMVYGVGTVADIKLFGPHNGQWVPQGYADEGKVSVFNNGGDNTQTRSSVHLIKTAPENGEYPEVAGVFEPADFDWSWTGNIMGEAMYEDRKSGVQSQPNGNLLICESLKGRITEITKNGDILWVYKNPVTTNVIDQFDPATFNTVFRAEKYPPNYLGFSGITLNPHAIIEDENNNSVICANPTSLEDLDQTSNLLANVSNENQIRFNRPLKNAQVDVFDVTGKVIVAKTTFSGSELQLNISSGVYLINVIEESNRYQLKIALP